MQLARQLRNVRHVAVLQAADAVAHVLPIALPKQVAHLFGPGHDAGTPDAAARQVPALQLVLLPPDQTLLAEQVWNEVGVDGVQRVSV